MIKSPSVTVCSDCSMASPPASTWIASTPGPTELVVGHGVEASTWMCLQLVYTRAFGNGLWSGFELGFGACMYTVRTGLSTYSGLQVARHLKFSQQGHMDQWNLKLMMPA